MQQQVYKKEEQTQKYKYTILTSTNIQIINAGRGNTPAAC
jgi:hypothetical protein